MELRNRGKLSFIFLCLAILISVVLIIEVNSGKALWIDGKITALFSGVPSYLHPFFIVLTALGEKIGIGIIALLMLVWLLIRKRDFTGMAAMALAVALGNEVSKWLKDFIARPRPDLEHLVEVKSYSFPSGHAMVGMILYFFIAYFLIRECRGKTAKLIIGIVIGVLLFLIGLSRIILQVHYPSDVIGGFALGYIWVYLWIFFYNFFKKREKKRA